MKKSGKLLKKSLSLLIVFVMIISMMPSVVFVQAEETLEAPALPTVSIVDPITFNAKGELASVELIVPISVANKVANGEKIYAVVEYTDISGAVSQNEKEVEGVSTTTITFLDGYTTIPNANVTAHFYIDADKSGGYTDGELMSDKTVIIQNQTQFIGSIVDVYITKMNQETDSFYDKTFLLGSQFANSNVFFTSSALDLNAKNNTTNESGEFTIAAPASGLSGLATTTEEQILYTYSTGIEGETYYYYFSKQPVKFHIGLPQTLTWSDGTLDGGAKITVVGDAFTSPTAASDQAGATITYSSSNTSVAQINENTGAITVVGSGYTTITATAAAVGSEYAEASIVYYLQVTPDLSAPSHRIYNGEDPFGSTGSIDANGHPIKIVAGTTQGFTNVLYDIDGSGTIEDTEYMQIGDTAPTAAGYDLSGFAIYGGASAPVMSANITMTGGSVHNVYVGGNVTTDAHFTMTGGTVNGALLGSGVKNDVYFDITGTSHIVGSVAPKEEFGSDMITVYGDAFITIGDSVKFDKEIPLNGENINSYVNIEYFDNITIANDLTESAQVRVRVPELVSLGTTIATSAVESDADKLVLDNGFVAQFDATNNTIVLAKALVTGPQTPEIGEAVTEGTTTKVEATVGTYTNGERAELTDVYIATKAIDAALYKASVDNTMPSVVLNIETAAGVKYTTIPLSGSSIHALAELNGDFAVNSGVAELSFDAAAIQKIAGAELNTLSLEVKNLTNKPDELTPEQQAKVGSNIVIDLTLHTESGMISDFGAGKVTVRVPVDYGTQNIEGVKVFFVKDDGTLEEMSATYYADEKMVEFTTNHFSVYMLEPVLAAVEPSNPNTTEPTTPTETPQTGDDSMIYTFIGIAVVSLIVILSAVSYLVIKKRKQIKH